jgi:hypothetical protein
MQVELKYPIEGMTVMPYGLPLMTPAWVGCMCWAADQPENIAQFEAETGVRFVNDHKVFVAFCDWATTNIWGVEGQDETAH